MRRRKIKQDRSAQKSQAGFCVTCLALNQDYAENSRIRLESTTAVLMSYMGTGTSELRFNQSVGAAFALVYYVDLVGFCI